MSTGSKWKRLQALLFLSFLATAMGFTRFPPCPSPAPPGTNACNCDANPDANSRCAGVGTCRADLSVGDGLTNFECTCPALFGGTFCQDNLERCPAGMCVATANSRCSTVQTSGATSINICVCRNNDRLVARGLDLLCEPVNECQENLDDCDDNAACTDTVESFTCTCNAGFEGSGRDGQCRDVDECARGLHTCARPGGACSNTVGAFTCSCAQGFEGDGLVCADVDECALSVHTCSDATPVCENTTPGFRCRGDEGSVLNSAGAGGATGTGPILCSESGSSDSISV